MVVNDSYNGEIIEETITLLSHDPHDSDITYMQYQNGATLEAYNNGTEYGNVIWSDGTEGWLGTGNNAGQFCFDRFIAYDP